MATTRDRHEAEIEQKLDMANSLLQSYAQDLRRVVASERDKTQALAVAHARVQLLDRLKLDFLVFIAHELNTPLSAIAAIDMLEEGVPRDDQSELVAIVKGGYERLHALVQKGLEYFGWMARSDIEVRRPCAVVPLLQQSIGDRQGVLRVDDADRDCRVSGDEYALLRTFSILVDNAVRFSGKQIEVLVARRQQTVRIAIVDRGIGFPSDLAEELFSPFTIADASHHSRGSGLSLAIARVIVAAHGGRLTAASEGPGSGATFCIELPLLEAAGGD